MLGATSDPLHPVHPSLSLFDQDSTSPFRPSPIRSSSATTIEILSTRIDPRRCSKNKSASPPATTTLPPLPIFTSSTSAVPRFSSAPSPKHHLHLEQQRKEDTSRSRTQDSIRFGKGLREFSHNENGKRGQKESDTFSEVTVTTSGRGSSSRRVRFKDAEGIEDEQDRGRNFGEEEEDDDLTPTQEYPSTEKELRRR
ncbi:hypothetical protein JCM3765_003519 [Sporobolomyces pararoseus]